MNAARQPFTTVTLNVVNIQKGNLHEILCTIISQNEMGKINLCDNRVIHYQDLRYT